MERTAIVTGGSQGLGRALVRRLLDDGWRVVTDARRADRLTATAAELTDDGRAVTADRLIALTGDIADEVHRRALVEAAGGRIHLVLNNASTLGATPLRRVDALSVEDLRATFDVNVVAPVALIVEAGTRLASGVAVVNVSSDAAIEVYETWGGYGASKAALDHLSRVLAAERPDLRVYAVDPGDMRTEMHQAAFPGEDIGDRPLPDASAAAIVALVDGDRPSGRYRTSDLVGEEVR